MGDQWQPAIDVPARVARQPRAGRTYHAILPAVSSQIFANGLGWIWRDRWEPEQAAVARARTIPNRKVRAA